MTAVKHRGVLCNAILLRCLETWSGDEVEQMIVMDPSLPVFKVKAIKMQTRV
jgi:hypothetical protein